MKRLKSAIFDSGLKQTHIAKKIGIDYSMLSKYVRGELECPDKITGKIASLLKIPKWQLLGDTDD